MSSDRERATPQRTLMFGLLFLLLLIAAIILGYVFLGKPPAAAPTATAALVPPAAPSDLTADVVAVFDVPVGWKDNSDNEDGFNIYRQRIDQPGGKDKAGAAGKDLTKFLDGGTVCGATYQYTVASYNAAGESPSTPCWQITLPACPAPAPLKLSVGDKTLSPDLYLSADGASLVSDQPGQNGVIDLGDIGITPLDQVSLPQPAAYKKDGVPVVVGHTYAVLMNDGQSVHVFTVNSIDAAMADTTGIIWHPGSAIIGECKGLPTTTTPPSDTPTSTATGPATQPRVTATKPVTTTEPPPCPSPNNPNCVPPPCSDAPGSTNPCTTPTTVVTTPPPGVCQEGWVPVGQCVCCGPNKVCPDHVEVNHPDCEEGGGNPGGNTGGNGRCTCIRTTTGAGYCKEDRTRQCDPGAATDAP